MHLIVGGWQFPNGQPSIYQGNQTYGFSCLAFETGRTYIFFNFKQWHYNNNIIADRPELEQEIIIAVTESNKEVKKGISVDISIAQQ